MKRRHVVVIFLLTASTLLKAQESVLYPDPTPPIGLNVGFEIGPNFSLFSQQISHSPIDNPTSPLRALESGGGVGGFGAVIVEYPFSFSVGLRLKGGLELKRVVASGTGVADCPQNEGGIFDTVEMSVRQTLSSLWITSGISLRFDIADKWYATVGPVWHRRVGEVSRSMHQEILSEGSCVFETTGEKTFDQSSTSSEGNRVNRFGFEGGVGYRHRLANNLWLLPELRFQYMLNSLAEEGSEGVDNFREKTLGRLNVGVDKGELHGILLGIGLLWSL
ncbi:MAG: outer membrane beta-barrel protein [Candidatus Kapaibacterium sp.]